MRSSRLAEYRSSPSSARCWSDLLALRTDSASLSPSIAGKRDESKSSNSARLQEAVAAQSVINVGCNSGSGQSRESLAG